MEKILQFKKYYLSESTIKNSVKGLKLLAVALFLSMNVLAQKDTLDSIAKKFPPEFNSTVPEYNSKSETQQSAKGKMRDGIIMQSGKMMIIKNGLFTEMKVEMYMSNGSKAMPNGMLVKKDGTKIMMHEGDYMDISGKITPSPKHRIK